MVLSSELLHKFYKVFFVFDNYALSEIMYTGPVTNYRDYRYYSLMILPNHKIPARLLEKTELALRGLDKGG